MPNSTRAKNKGNNTSPKKPRVLNNRGVKHPVSKKPQQQKAGGSNSDICQKDLNQILMGNPPASIGGPDTETVWKDTKRTAKDLDSFSKKGWGNYPGTPPKPDCVIL